MQQHLFEPRAPFSEPTTSFEAAESLKAPENIREIVFIFVHTCRSRGATCEEVEKALNLKHQTASARLWELCGNGKHDKRIIKTEERRKTTSGRFARVYKTEK